MSTVVSLTGTQNPLKVQFFPPIEGWWEVGLLSLQSRNTVPNITACNNIFYYGKGRHFEVPTGYYTLSQLAHVINIRLSGLHREEYEKLTEPQRKLLGFSLIKIGWNSQQNRVEILSALPITAHGDHSIVAALGFESDELMAMRVNIAEGEMHFYDENLICVECSDVVGGFRNGVRGRTIYEFNCLQRAGERYEEKPNIVTYFPVCNRTSLRELEITLCDGENKPLNLLNELTLVRLHLKHHASGI